MWFYYVPMYFYYVSLCVINGIYTFDFTITLRVCNLVGLVYILKLRCIYRKTNLLSDVLRVFIVSKLNSFSFLNYTKSSLLSNSLEFKEKLITSMWKYNSENMVIK